MFVVNILCFTLLFQFGSTNQKIKIGCITTGDLNVNWDVLTGNLDSQLEVEIQTLQLQEKEFLAATNTICNIASQEDGLVACVDSGSEDLSNNIRAVADYLGVPYINTDWAPRDSKQFDTTFSVYPEATLLSEAYGDIVESLDWSLFAVIYENEESLVRMQDVIKLQHYKADMNKNTLLIKKLDESGDSRHIFKEIRSTQVNCIVLDCSVDKIIDILLQAQDVKLLDDISTHLFLTSLDAHTLDYSILNTKINITTVRMFDTSLPQVQDMIAKSYPEIAPNQLTVKMALMHDAMLLLAESLNAIKSTHADGEIVYEPLFCNASEKYNDKYSLVSTLQEVTVTGITGEINLSSGKRDTFQLNIVELSKPLVKLDTLIGEWSTREQGEVIRKRNATEIEAALQERLRNHRFIVTSKIGPPYLGYNPDKNAVGNNQFIGYSMDLITEIAKILNISFEFMITKGSEYGNLQKDLIERRADLAICDYTITPQRQEDIDFSLPFMSLGIGILHKKTEIEEEANIYGFLGPLSTVVWMYTGALYLFLSFILLLIARLSNEDWENPHPCDENPAELENIWNLKNCLWLTLGSITTQGCDILPKGVCSRIATASWWFFSLILTSSYTANLAAFLTMSKKDDSINSVEELAAQSKIKYGLVKNGATASFFQYSNNSLYQRMWNTMINEKPSVFEDKNTDGVERVLSTKNSLYAFFMESTGIDYELERKCNLRRIGDLLDSKSYGIGMPFNADYRHSINKAILRLQENGKLGELKEKWWKKEREGEPCPSGPPESSDALALENVGGVFIVLAAGIGIAFLIAILEFLWNVYSIAVEEHISYLDALKVELKFAFNIFVTKKRAKPLISESSSSTSSVSKSNKGILIGAGSVLNINTSILNRIGASMEPNGRDLSQTKKSSKASS